MEAITQATRIALKAGLLNIVQEQFQVATPSRRPLSYVFSQEFATREEALASEQQIKGWGRKKKEAMIRGDWVEVSRLARSSLKPQ